MLHAIFTKVYKDFDAVLGGTNGEDDHVHLLVEYPHKVALSTLVNSLKGVSSGRLRQQHLEIAHGITEVGSDLRVTLLSPMEEHHYRSFVNILTTAEKISGKICERS